MELTKQQVTEIDKVLKFLCTFREPSLQLKIYKEEGDNNADIGKLNDLLMWVFNYQTRNGLLLIAVLETADPINRMKDLSWFINTGGFTKIWEDENTKQQQVLDLNQSVIDTNKNVKKTNNKTWVIASLAAVFALGSLITDILDKPEPVNKTIEQILQTQTQLLDSIRQNQKHLNNSIDSLTKAVSKKK